ncbi:MAG: restriction endonuclease [Clostridiaceae bacterium]|nr:restriction endonuclease [Clostridiaceae bacterium]
MTPEELRNSILQYAIQGKLVEQRKEEGTGEELFQQIQAEKQKLIKEGIIRKEKALPEITEEEMPFDIPESWNLVRFSSVISLLSGADLTPDKYNSLENGIPYITGASNIENGILEINRWTEYPNNIAIRGDLLLTCKGTVGKTVILEEEKVHIARQLMSITTIVVDTSFIRYFVESRVNYLKTQAKSMIPGITRNNVLSLVLPLPPLAEQKRIVAKIEELLPYIDCYEEVWTKLEDFNNRFPEDMQKSLLQYAIQGKLVEQREEEGTGEELYQQIQIERERLIAKKAIKVEKPLAPITDEEKPFDIPENWTWVRFGNLGSYRKGPFGSALTKNMFVPKGNNSVKVYEQKNAIQKDATLGEYYITRDYFENKMTGFEVFPGDIIVSCAGTIGETYVLPDDIEQGIINQALMRMKLFEPIYVPYFLVFFDVVLKENARAHSKGSAIKNIPPFKILKNYLIPLPPLAEQKRIVAKLEELLPLCDRLK